MTTSAACACGQTGDHEIARRSTADRKTVLLWSDGQLTFALGFAIRGVGRPRSAVQRDRALRVGWLVAGECSLYEAGELPDVIRAARRVVDRGGTLPGDVRAEFAAQCARDAEPAMPGGWTVLASDSDGRTTCRVWTFPRLSPLRDYGIWHEHGIYAVMVRATGMHGVGLRSLKPEDNVFMPTGFVRSTLRGAYIAVRMAAGTEGAD